MNKVLFKKKVH